MDFPTETGSNPFNVSVHFNFVSASRHQDTIETLAESVLWKNTIKNFWENGLSDGERSLEHMGRFHLVMTCL